MYDRDYSDKNIAFLFAIKNRTKFCCEDGEILNLLRNCLDTLCNNLSNFAFKNVDFYFANFSSDDCNFDEEIRNHIKEPFKYNIKNISDEFNKGIGYNTLLEHIGKDKYNCIAFIDADMLFVRETILYKAFNFCLKQNKSYFPICLRLTENGHTKSPEMDGLGNCFIQASIIFDNNIKFINKNTWGEEDTIFYNTINNYSQTVIEIAEGFYHQWHPATWKRGTL
jgi:hypothetical protein